MTRIEFWGPPGCGKSNLIDGMRKAGFDVRDAPDVFDVFGREAVLTSRKTLAVQQWLRAQGVTAVRYSADKKTVVVTLQGKEHARKQAPGQPALVLSGGDEGRPARARRTDDDLRRDLGADAQRRKRLARSSRQ